MYECFHCGHRSVRWEADFDYADYGLDGVGIVHCCHCDHCGADIEYYITITEEDVEELEGKDNDKVHNSVCADHEEKLAEDSN